jgi:hypothetical protein
MGRTFDSPDRLTLRSRSAAVRITRRGGSLTAAAAAAGVSDRTVRRWLALAKQHPRSSYAAFAAALSGARQEFIERMNGSASVSTAVPQAITADGWDDLTEAPAALFGVVDESDVLEQP